jgi:hypothetical protein
VKQESVQISTAVTILICKFKFAVSYPVLRKDYTSNTDLYFLPVARIVNTHIFCLCFNIVGCNFVLLLLDGSESNSQFTGFDESFKFCFNSNMPRPSSDASETDDATGIL